MFTRNTNNMKKSKKLWLKLTAGILTMAGTVTALAACNNTTTNQPDNPNPVDPNPPEQTISVSLIYDGIGVSMDTKAMLQTEVNQIAENVYGDADVKAYGLKDDDLQVISMVGDELSSVVVSLPQETIDYLKGDVKDSVLSKAGLTPQQEVKESEKSQIVEKISNAVDYIESKIGAISDLPVGNVNYYTKGEATENADKTFSVIGPVLEDGTFQIFDISTNGDLYETIISVPGSANKTPEQIYQDYYNGNYIASASKLIDLNSTYTAPKPIDPSDPGGEVEEKITIGEIFDQNFSNIDFSAQLNNMFVGLVQKGFTNAENVKVLAHTIENSKLNIYYEMTRNSLASFNKLSLDTPEIVNEINTNLKDYILQQLGYSADAEVDKESSSEYVSQINQVVQQIESEIMAVVDQTNIRDMSNTTYGRNGANAPENVNDFGEALLGNMGEKGTIIATYVGDMGARHIDSGNMFDNSGYYTQYSITVVYQTSNGISITSCNIYNAWFTDSTNESLYGNLINGTKDYQLGTPKTETIDNPLLLNEKKVEELSISL